MRKLVSISLLPLSGLGLLLTAWYSNAQRPPASILGSPLPGLTDAQRVQFEEGRVVFATVEDPDEGLGPVFNGRSCGECHLQGALGGAGNDLVQTRVTRFGAIENGAYTDLPELGGPLIQRRSVQELDPLCPIPPETVPAEAQFVSHRITTPLFGLGLIEAIPERTILANTDPHDRNHDGISGHPNIMFNPETQRNEVGRFGWKAQVSSIHFFSGDAYLNEMGITSATFPAENLPQGVPIPPEWDPVSDPEESAASPNDVDRFTNFMRFLAPPEAKRLSEAGRRGETLFRSLQCASCHVPSMNTGPNPVRALAFKDVRLYSDLLLHDMGKELGDGVRQREASGSEFRTAPLWGVSGRQFLLHDGRATSLKAAIMAHGGEAANVRNAFGRLRDRQREDLLVFLTSL